MTAFVLAEALLAGCAAKAAKEAAPPPPPVESVPEQAAAAPDPCREDLARLDAERERSKAELRRLREQLAASRLETAAAEERLETLRREMERSIEDVLASKASLRGVNNRALAISRIAEVRVQAQSVGRRGQPEVASRLRSAEALLERADAALEEGNYGGAAYLAERAGETIRQARAVGERAARQTAETAGLIPIVPPRTIEVAVNANLRSGPDLARARVGTAPAGTRLVAVGRLGEWFEVETSAGDTAWLHRTTIR